MRAMIVICCWLSVLAQRASGQEKYLPPPDTVFILLVNPYRMYWVRGGDTLSQPMHTVSVEAQRWDRDGQHLVVGVRQLQLDVHRRTKVDTFNITSLGVVQKINGHRPGLDERIDLLPRLPGRALESGVIWADTLRSSESGGPRGDALYFVSRTYRVGRLFDSAGTRLAEVSAAGLVRYRDSWWVDSLAGKSVSIDVTGPVTERFVFALREGRLLDRSWSMDLKGRGTLPGDRGGTDTTTAGLVSAETERVIVPDRAHRLTRALPGPDTSVSLDPGPILLHTVLRQPHDIEAGMARNDGLVGTAHARFDGGHVQSYEALWTDTSVTPRRVAISYVRDSLRVREAGRPDTTVAIPEPWWGVADYAMNELLVPTFLTHAADGIGVPFAIYRPYPRHWDRGTANLRSRGEILVAAYRVGDDTAMTYLLISKDGDLLMAENSGPTGAQRMPPDGSPRRARLEAILKTLQR